jgi:hypothetical protein
MATETTSIDDVLATAHLPAEQRPLPPESRETEPEPEPVYEELHESKPEPEDEPEEVKEPEPEPESSNEDDYGNPVEKQESKTYTEDEVNERINKAVRERLARLERKQEITPQQAQTAATNFEYNPDDAGDWQQQLKQFVKQTYQETMQEQQQAVVAQREQQVQAEFETKLFSGMGKFQDFRDVVGQQPITDAMTMATRAMSDPAAFLYAASKRHSVELQRIAKIGDPYAQMVEIGKLEERMRKGKATTSAPRPVSRTREDSSMTTSKDDRPKSIEEMIAESDAKRLKLRMAARR